MLRHATPCAGPTSCADLAALATLSLKAEAALTPKPGLVDAATSGAHDDMALGTFLASADALAPYFGSYARAGADAGAAAGADGAQTAAGSAGDAMLVLARRLREQGMPAETAMFAATGGVNTHKGANFSFALILGATAYALASAPAGAAPTGAQLSSAVLSTTSRLGETLFAQDRERLPHEQRSRELSHGERLYLEHGVTGVRGEAAAGYPALSHVLLPRLRAHAAHGMGARESLLRALVALMATIEDTNLLHRGGPAALGRVRRECAELDAAAPSLPELERALCRYDKVLTGRWLSPGGSADLLSLGIYFAVLEGLWGAGELDWV